MIKRQLLGVVGANGSGKTTLCQYLETKGYHFISLSSIVRHYVSDLGLPEERDILIEHANQLKSKHGLDYFAQKSMSVASEQGHAMVVFDSIRHPLELQFLKEQGVHMIGIRVPIDIRYQRIKNRQAQTDSVSFEQFVKQDEKEASGDSLGQSIKQTLALCDIIIDNDAGLSELRDKIDAAVKQFESEI